jgi:histidinol phosphatase-like enzyme
MRHVALLSGKNGAINLGARHIHDNENIYFFDRIFELVVTVHANAHRYVVVTNQAEIACDYYTAQQYHELKTRMCNEFSNAGTLIQEVHFSSFYPTEGLAEYKKHDFSPKLNLGMILQAQQELNLDLHLHLDLDLDLGSFIFIGDRVGCIQAGIAVGFGLNILFAQEQPSDLSGLPYQPIANLCEPLPFTIDFSRQRRLAS